MLSETLRTLAGKGPLRVQIHTFLSVRYGWEYKVGEGFNTRGGDELQLSSTAHDGLPIQPFHSDSKPGAAQPAVLRVMNRFSFELAMLHEPLSTHACDQELSQQKGQGERATCLRAV